MIEVRTGNTAVCKSCGNEIPWGFGRVVETPATDHAPEHHHIDCYKKYIPNLEELLAILKGEIQAPMKETADPEKAAARILVKRYWKEYLAEIEQLQTAKQGVG